MSVNENETVNQSQSAAGGSGEKPEKLVADHVEKSWEYITENGFDLLADVAVDTLVKNGAVPSDAYLHSVKTSWCLHRAAVHYARQYSVERVSADFARRDAQFEHSLRAQAEREAEKLKADLAQSVLLVESQRLRIEEARAKETESPAAKWCRKIRELQNSLQQRQQELSSAFASNEELRQSLRSHKMKLETAEAALLEQQQRNEALVTQGSQQRMKIAELQRQVEAVKTQELDGKKQELPEKTQELPAEYTPPEGWRALPVGEPLQNGDQWITESGAVEVLREVKTEIVQPNGHYIRQIQPEPEKLPEGCRNDGGWSNGVNGTEPEPWPEPQPETTTEQLADTSGRDIVQGLVLQVADLIQREEAEIEGQAADTPATGYTPPEGWRVLVVGEVLREGDMWVWPTDDQLRQTVHIGAVVGANQRYIRRIKPQVEALTMNGGDNSGGN